MARAKQTKREPEPERGKAKDLKKRELTDEERARLQAYGQRAAQAKPVKFKANDDANHAGALTVVDPDDPLIPAKLAEAFGTTDPDVIDLLFRQAVQTFVGVAVANDVCHGDFDRNKAICAINQAAALLAGIQPQDELEGMLAIQMIAVHNAAMHTAARRSRGSGPT